MYSFLPPSLVAQWRMWLHFLCLFLFSEHKPESWNFSLYKASSSRSFSCLVVHATKFTPGNISNSWKEGREAAKENSSPVSRRARLMECAEPVWPTTTLPMMRGTGTKTAFFANIDLQFVNLEVVERTNFVSMFSWMSCEIWLHFLSPTAKVKAMLLCLSLACFPQTWKNLLDCSEALLAPTVLTELDIEQKILETAGKDYLLFYYLEKIRYVHFPFFCEFIEAKSMFVNKYILSAKNVQTPLIGKCYCSWWHIRTVNILLVINAYS